jgi:DNA replication protein DnaC
MEVKATLVEQLRALRLPAFRDGFEEAARKAMQETLSYEQYLLELTYRECDERRARRIERLLRESRLPLEKTLSSFDLQRLPTKVSRQLRKHCWKAGSWNAERTYWRSGTAVPGKRTCCAPWVRN